jgi:hypothetical protein
VSGGEVDSLKISCDVIVCYCRIIVV